MSRIALVLALLGSIVLGAGMPPCCIFADAPELPPQDHGDRCPCCPDDAPTPPAPSQTCVWAHAVSTLSDATDTVQLDAPAPSAFVAPETLLPVDVTAAAAPVRESGPPGPALTLPLLL